MLPQSGHSVILYLIFTSLQGASKLNRPHKGTSGTWVRGRGCPHQNSQNEHTATSNNHNNDVQPFVHIIEYEASKIKYDVNEVRLTEVHLSTFYHPKQIPQLPLHNLRDDRATFLEVQRDDNSTIFVNSCE